MSHRFYHPYSEPTLRFPSTRGSEQSFNRKSSIFNSILLNFQNDPTLRYSSYHSVFPASNYLRPRILCVCIYLLVYYEYISPSFHLMQNVRMSTPRSGAQSLSQKIQRSSPPSMTVIRTCACRATQISLNIVTYLPPILLRRFVNFERRRRSWTRVCVLIVSIMRADHAR